MVGDLKEEYGEQHVWVPTAELLSFYLFFVNSFNHELCDFLGCDMESHLLLLIG